MEDCLIVCVGLINTIDIGVRPFFVPRTTQHGGGQSDRCLHVRTRSRRESELPKVVFALHVQRVRLITSAE